MVFVLRALIVWWCVYHALSFLAFYYSSCWISRCCHEKWNWTCFSCKRDINRAVGCLQFYENCGNRHFFAASAEFCRFLWNPFKVCLLNFFVMLTVPFKAFGQSCNCHFYSICRHTLAALTTTTMCLILTIKLGQFSETLMTLELKLWPKLMVAACILLVTAGWELSNSVGRIFVISLIQNTAVME